MKNHFSILKVCDSSISGEFISVGLIYVWNNISHIKLSDHKLNIAKKLYPKNAKLIDFTIDKLKFYFSNPNANQGNIFKNSDREDYLNIFNKLSIYNNGVVQFTVPQILAEDSKLSNFNLLFEKIIGLESKKGKRITSDFNGLVKSNFTNPLKDHIDIDFKINKKTLPSLYFNYCLDGIGVNGALYTAKSIDLNLSDTDSHINDIKTKVTEYEVVISRLKDFAKQKNINGDHKFYLLADEYKGRKKSYLDLYTLFKGGDNSANIKLITPNEFNSVTQLIIKNKASKFSHWIEN